MTIEGWLTLLFAVAGICSTVATMVAKEPAAVVIGAFCWAGFGAFGMIWAQEKDK